VQRLKIEQNFCASLNLKKLVPGISALKLTELHFIAGEQKERMQNAWRTSDRANCGTGCSLFTQPFVPVELLFVQKKSKDKQSCLNMLKHNDQILQTMPLF